MDKESLRPVSYLMECSDEDGRFIKKRLNGWFHGYAKDLDNQTYAIIEKEDGAIRIEYLLTRLKFLDR